MLLNGINLPDTCSNYYELLGLNLFEGDRVLVESKVRALMREARKYQVGQFSAQAEKCLDLLASARACLLDPDQKQKYDESLRVQFGFPPVTVVSTYNAATAAAPAGVSESPSSAAPPSLPDESSPEPTALPLPRHGARAMAMAAASVAVLAIGLWCVGAFSRHSGSGTSGDEFAEDESSDQPPAAAAAHERIEISTGPVSAPPNSLPAAQQAAAQGTRNQRGSEERAMADARNNTGAAPRRTEPPRQPAAADRRVAVNNAARPVSPMPQRPAEPPAKSPEKRPDDSPVPLSVSRFDPSSSMEKKKTPMPDSAKEDEEMLESSASAAAASKGTMSKEEILRELKSIRLGYNRMTMADKRNKRSQTWMRARRVVQLGSREFADDTGFQQKLKQESVALGRMFPELQQALKDLFGTK